MILSSHGLFGQDYDSRKLLLFAGTGHDKQLKEQLAILHADANGLKERQLVYAVVTRVTDSALYARTMKKTDRFLMLLYGKDGGVKFTSTKPVSLQQLYGIIDSMPMRKEEIKQQQRKQ